MVEKSEEERGSCSEEELGAIYRRINNADFERGN